jgi:cation transport protein ChaC
LGAVQEGEFAGARDVPAGGRGHSHWVFGYGSLMWRPGFDYLERIGAVLHGRRRAFCIYSVHHRGTPQRPGLVLGLAAGGSVRGIAYRVDAAKWDHVYDYLREREHPAETYVEARVRVALANGLCVDALTFISDQAHPRWAGDLALDAQAKLIAGAQGLSGRNIEYLRDLVMHLRKGAAQDDDMEMLLADAERLEAVDGLHDPHNGDDAALAAAGVNRPLDGQGPTRL